MARYTGPKAKKCRRLGTNIYESTKYDRILEARAYPPGEHGRRRIRESEYLLQLREKQKARFMYGLLERQFRKVYEEANRQSGVTGENLLRLLERRLDNVMFRAGIASTRPQARQLVGHGHVLVNGRRVNIPSFLVRPGDVITLTDKARALLNIRHNIDTLDRKVPAWLEFNSGDIKVTVRDLPIRAQIDVPVREQLIVELYSK